MGTLPLLFKCHVKDITIVLIPESLCHLLFSGRIDPFSDNDRPFSDCLCNCVRGNDCLLFLNDGWSFPSLSHFFYSPYVSRCRAAASADRRHPGVKKGSDILRKFLRSDIIDRFSVL